MHDLIIKISKQVEIKDFKEYQSLKQLVTRFISDPTILHTVETKHNFEKSKMYISLWLVISRRRLNTNIGIMTLS